MLNYSIYCEVNIHGKLQEACTWVGHGRGPGVAGKGCTWRSADSRDAIASGARVGSATALYTPLQAVKRSVFV